MGDDVGESELGGEGGENERGEVRKGEEVGSALSASSSESSNPLLFWCSSELPLVLEA